MGSYLLTFILFAVIPFTISLSINEDPAIHLYLQEGSQIKLGRGNNANDIPIIECTSSQKTFSLNCTINIRSKKDKCQLVLSPDDNATFVKVDSLYQFPENKVIVVWQQSSKNDASAFARKITTIAIENCTNLATLSFPKNAKNWRDLQAIVLYENSFDAIVAAKPKGAYREGKRSRISYNLDGNEIETSTMSPGSTQHGRGNEQVKDVLTFFNGEFKEQKVTCTESGKYNTICGEQSKNDSRRFVCVQMGANQPMYRQELRLPEDTQIIGVRNFKDGGMMLFGLESNSKLTVAEMRFSHRPKVRSVKLKWPVSKTESAVIDFREKRNDLHFTLIGETDEFNHSVVMQFFRLVDKSVSNHRRRS